MREYCEDCACEPAGVCRHCFEQLESENKRLREQCDKLEKENQELQDQYRWRDVKEELPEESGKYLVLTSAMYAHMIDFNKSCYDFRERFTYVTHWMPIPPLNQKEYEKWSKVFELKESGDWVEESENAE